MKKVITIMAMALAMSTALVGCGEKEKTEKVVSAETTADCDGLTLRIYQTEEKFPNEDMEWVNATKLELYRNGSIVYDIYITEEINDFIAGVGTDDDINKLISNYGMGLEE